ncbi:MAG: hypothetical protein NC408_09340 [Candidatus Gastranaerophilales bacterium]|nr:hypothetical protein [Candidatus Gastranaerophilales bacterium]MCM1073888.1 hypothetical protein [Bacteroides sp.]
MKKILLIIPVVFCLVLNSLSIISVHASDIMSTDAVPYEGSSFYVHPLEQLLEQTNPKYYFWYNTYKQKGDGSYDIETKFIIYNDEISVEEDNGVYTISFLGRRGFFLYNIGHQSLPNYDFNSLGSSDDVSKTLIFDSNTNELFRVRDNSEQVSYITDGFSFNVFETNMFEADSNELDIDVIFTPNLSGSCDFTHKIVNDVPPLSSNPLDKPEGSTFEHTIQSNNFSIDVRNNSKFGVQVLMAIVPQGESLSFHSVSELGATAVSSVYDTRTNPLFVWWSEEWNYFYDSLISHSDTSFTDWGSKFTCSKQLSNVPWHYVGCKSSITHNFSLDQMKIQKGVKYDVLVYAVKCDYGCASRQSAFENADYYVDYSSIQLVYSSNFWITFSVEFNPNSTYGGNVVFTNPSEAVMEGWKSKGYIDPVTGETVIKSKNFNDYSDANSKITGDPTNNHPDVGAAWGIGDSPGSSSGFGLTSFTSLTGTIRSFFGFLSTTLSYFPSNIYSVISLALTSFLILAIIRRVR